MTPWSCREMEALTQTWPRFSRRTLLANASAFGVAALLGTLRPAAAEAPPEVTKIRFVHTPAICLSPQYLADEFLRLEGFSEIEYVDIPTTKTLTLVEEGRADMTMGGSPDIVAALDAGRRILPLAGIHAGCYELFVNGSIASIRDLKGKSVAVTGEDSTERLFMASFVAYVGVNPRDIRWITTSSTDEAMQTFAGGKADAFLAFAAQPVELRTRKIGRVILDTTQDRPWSQYFCCMLSARREFVEKYPVATRRVLRAVLKAADLCAQEPDRAARYLAAKGYEARTDIALEVLKGLPYRRWRDADPEDTLRFHALRLHEAGLIKNTPQKLLAQNTDWHFLTELKRELKQ